MEVSKLYNPQSPFKRISGLGFTASGKRSILPGKAYERLFPRPLQVDPFLTNNGTVYDTLEFCADIISKTLGDTKQIAQLLKRDTLTNTCKAIFDFFYKHYQYKIDEPGIEQLRRPCRAFSDRFKGIDCDCFSISVSSILLNLKISHSLRMVKMYNRDYFQHIYVVIPKFPGADMTKRTNYYVIDPVVDKYDLEAPGVTEIKDKQMTVQGMPIQYLNGVGTTRLGEEFNGLGDNLGDTDHMALYKDYCRRCKMNLVNTRNHIAKHPQTISHVYNVHGLVGAYDQLIGAWDNENSRAAMLEKLSGIEESFLQPSFQGLGDIIHGSDNELFGLINADLEGINGLEGKKKHARKAATGSHTKNKKTGVFTKIKNANKAAIGKGKGVLKKIGKVALSKNSPLAISIRIGVLTAMKTNTLRLASRAYWALFSEADALKAGVSKSFYKKAKICYDYLKTVFTDKVHGDESVLQKSIITGRAAKVAKKLAKKGKLNGIDELMGVSGLGVVATATIAAAMTFLTTIAAFFTKVMGKQGNSEKEESETGGETNATSPDAANALTQTDAGPTVSNDGAEKLYNRHVNKSGGGSPAGSADGSGDGKGSSDEESDHAGIKIKPVTDNNTTAINNGDTDKPLTQSDAAAALNKDTPKEETEKNDEDKKNEPSSHNGKGLAATVIALAAIGTIAAISHNKKGKDSGGKKSETTTSDLHGIAKQAIKKKILKVTLT